METNIGMSECDKNVDNFYGRNFESPAAPAERLSTVSSPFLSIIALNIKSHLRQQKNRFHCLKSICDHIKNSNNESLI